MKSILSVLFVCTILTTNAQKKSVISLVKAESAYSSGNHELWYNECVISANSGNDTALLYLAWAFDPYYAEKFPFPKEKDAVKSFDYYKKSANAGNSEGSFMTAELYRLGEGVEKNLNEAIVYYKKAFSLNHPSAGEILYKVLGTENYIAFLKECVSNKNYNAAQELATIYINGSIVAANIDEAMKWLEIGEKNNHGGCLYVLGYLHRNGFKKGVDGKVTLNEDKSDINKAIYYYTLAGKYGSTDALNNLGEIYMGGIEVSQDYPKSFENFKTSCFLNNGYACHMCSVLLTGSLVKSDSTSAQQYANMALELGYQPEK
jgi:TPR repeat protein